MQRIKILLILGLCTTTLPGCTTLKEYVQGRKVLSAIDRGNLKGTDKIEVIEKFGKPVATSKSEVSECWYYAEPKSIWIWFEDDKVDHWEIEE